MTKFILSERNFWPGCRELDIVGELDLAVCDRLRAALDEAVAKRLHVLVDLSRCDFIDVSGVQALVQGHDRLATHGRQLLLYGVQGQVKRMLSVTGLAGVDHGGFEIAPPEALAAA
jgi:anti-anti-sigma factor